jgi:hypothetical protein
MEATPPPQDELTQPPPPSYPSDDEKAGGGMRALAVVLALVLAFGAAVMIIAGADISDTPIAADCIANPEVIPDDGECFDGSDSNQTIVTILLYASGAFAAVAALLALAFAVTGIRGRLAIQVALVAVVVGAIALII